jgi:hypothetical protein
MVWFRIHSHIYPWPDVWDKIVMVACADTLALVSTAFVQFVFHIEKWSHIKNNIRSNMQKLSTWLRWGALSFYGKCRTLENKRCVKRYTANILILQNVKLSNLKSEPPIRITHIRKHYFQREPMSMSYKVYVCRNPLSTQSYQHKYGQSVVNCP